MRKTNIFQVRTGTAPIVHSAAPVSDELVESYPFDARYLDFGMNYIGGISPSIGQSIPT
ncbi:MAG: hypothetical protein IJ200_05360 [Prevotella sp.]|nr:hypothetical protein [Prevotella sp.]MBQ8065065.1 hypothetical protein [Prevotella sp.]